MKFVLVERIKPLNEGKKISHDTYLFESAESLFEFLQVAKQNIRLLYDHNIDKYFACYAANGIHLDLLRDAYKAGYYISPNSYASDYIRSLQSVYFIPINSRDYDWVFDDSYMYFDGYKTYIKTDIGRLFARENGFPEHLYNLLKRKNLINDEGEVEEVNESLLTEVYPNKGESKDDFISRFMSVTKDEYPDQKQRCAVALSYWDRRNK